MNTTIWTGVDLPLGAENLRVAEIRQDAGGTIATIEYNCWPVVYGARRHTGVIRPMLGQLGGGDTGDENDAKPRQPAYDWPFRESPADIIARGPDHDDLTEIKCGRCGHRFLVNPVSTTVSCPACGLSRP